MHLRVTAIAKGLDCESNVIRLRIDWDGVWERDDIAIKKHFRKVILLLLLVSGLALIVPMSIFR